MARQRRQKPISLPRIGAADVDLAHILEGHCEGGSRAGSSKTLFPAGWTGPEVLASILAAYRVAKRMQRQGDRIKVQGVSHGLTLEMWVNMTDRRIETAYPV